MKKTLTVFVALALLIACIPVASATDTPTISAGTASALAGETVQIPVCIENNPGIMSCFVSVSYDRNLLTLTAADYADLFTGGSPEASGSLTQNPFNMLWYDFTANRTNSGDFFLLTFAISEDAVPGDLTITVAYSQDNTFDYDGNDVVFSTQNGKITVLAPEVGGWSFSEDCTLYTYEGENNVNFIGGVNSLDDPYMSDYIETTGGWTYAVEDNDAGAESTGAKLTIFDETGTAVEEYYLVYFGDANGDGVINGMDILVIMDMISGDWGDFILSDEFPQTFAADLNHDGNVNGMDILCVMDCVSVDDAQFQFIPAD